jgi:TPR repeat protein
MSSRTLKGNRFSLIALFKFSAPALYGHGVAQDYKEAVKWYQLAAEQGNAEAQYNFGRMYRYGQGVEKNFDEACRLNKLASDQGNVIAQYYS